jgi:hypothetical protein
MIRDSLGLGVEFCNASTLQAQTKIAGQCRQILLEGHPPQHQDLHEFFRYHTRTAPLAKKVGVNENHSPQSAR